MPVDLYVGGAEHAVLHLLYARFWHKVLYDRGHVTTREPFQKLVNQGMILGEVEYTGYQCDGQWFSTSDLRRNEDGVWVVAKTMQVVVPVVVAEAQVVKKGDGFVLEANPAIRVDSRAHKMSKSRGNVVNPDQVVREHGADALRLYEMFMGPLEATKPWSTAGVSGVRNFLDRVWRMFVDHQADGVALLPAIQDVAPTAEQNQVLHRTIGAVTADIEAMSFNTAIARMMEFVNFFTKCDVRPRSAMSNFVLLLSPFAPHLAEELWQLLGNPQSLAYQPWPQFDAAAAKSSEIEVPLQVNGKLRGRITVPADCTKEDLERLALADPRTQELLEGKQIVKTIVVPGRLVNWVVKQ